MHHPPRALLRRQTITVELTPTELYSLVRVIETDAVEAAGQNQTAYADYLLERVAQLREAGR